MRPVPQRNLGRAPATDTCRICGQRDVLQVDRGPFRLRPDLDPGAPVAGNPRAVQADMPRKGQPKPDRPPLRNRKPVDAQTIGADS